MVSDTIPKNNLSCEKRITVTVTTMNNVVDQMFFNLKTDTINLSMLHIKCFVLSNLSLSVIHLQHIMPIKWKSAFESYSASQIL